jgi:hypothetical protein
MINKKGRWKFPKGGCSDLLSLGKRAFTEDLLLKEKGGRLGLVLWSSVYNHTSPTVPGFQARQTRNKRY